MVYVEVRRHTRERVKRVPGVWKHDDFLTGATDLDVQSRQLWNCTSDSAPSEARIRGSEGGTPRKHDDLLTGASDLNVQSRQLWSCTSDSVPSEARKRGSGGGSPRKYDDLSY
jgi:hypothetical protein